jgi:ABC-type nitrate/sulfonate/bicarbonate transport system ATPase subunit
MDAVKIENLVFAYPEESPIFQDFNLNIGAGERWSIIGPSGCGKTTLLYLLAGLRQPCRGQIRQNRSVSNGRKAKTGLVLQDLGLLPWATAAENLSLGLRIHKVGKAAAERITQNWLDRKSVV